MKQGVIACWGEQLIQSFVFLISFRAGNKARLEIPAPNKQRPLFAIFSKKRRP